MSWTTRSPEETRALGRELAVRLRPDGLLLLTGDLGAGKTVLAQGVAEGLGIDPSSVQSPTYTLIHEHEGDRDRLVHVDLYRLEGDEVWGIGLEEALEAPGVKVVEWAERLPVAWPGAICLSMSVGSGGERTLTETSPQESP